MSTDGLDACAKRCRGRRLCQTLIGALHTDLMDQELGLVVSRQGCVLEYCSAVPI
jgi:hypothetical protein